MCLLLLCLCCVLPYTTSSDIIYVNMQSFPLQKLRSELWPLFPSQSEIPGGGVFFSLRLESVCFQEVNVYQQPYSIFLHMNFTHFIYLLWARIQFSTDFISVYWPNSSLAVLLTFLLYFKLQFRISILNWLSSAGWCGSVDWALACEQRGHPLITYKAHAWVAGQGPSRGRVRGNCTLMFPSLSPSPPL